MNYSIDSYASWLRQRNYVVDVYSFWLSAYLFSHNRECQIRIIENGDEMKFRILKWKDGLYVEEFKTFEECIAFYELVND